MQSVEASQPRALGFWLLGVGATLLGAIGQLLFRRFGLAQSSPNLLATLSESLFESKSFELPVGLGYLVAGVFCYFIAVPLWVRVLRDLPLSRAYPLLSLSYPLVYVGAIWWLGESISLTRTLGTALVTLGALLAVAPATVPATTSTRVAD